MSHIVKAGALILTPAEVRVLYQVAGIRELRQRYRIGDTNVYQILCAISEAAFAPAADGNLPRQPAASEEREWWTVPELSAATGRSQRAIRLDCHTGALPARKHNRAWLISTSDAATYRNGRRTP